MKSIMPLLMVMLLAGAAYAGIKLTAKVTKL